MDERLTTIKGIGPGREKQLHKLGITNITSLLTYFPRTYEDRRTIYRIGELKSGIRRTFTKRVSAYMRMVKQSSNMGLCK